MQQKGEELKQKGVELKQKGAQELKKIKKNWRKFVTGDDSGETTIREFSKDKVFKGIRKAVTGDKDKLVVVYLKEEPVVRLIDKCSFFVGVWSVLLCEMVLLLYPHYFYVLYSLIYIGSVIPRYFQYKKAKWHFFMLDFCYYVNWSLIGLLLMSKVFHVKNRLCSFIWRCLFTYANGPVLCAVLGWRVTMAFHSVDRMTSFFMHVLPAVVTYCERWHGGEDIFCDGGSYGCTYGFQEAFVDPLVGYVIWQSAYLLITEVIYAEKLDLDPELITSMRWLANDHKNSFNKIALKIARGVRFFSPQENFTTVSPIKVKFVMVMFQAIYTWVLIVPCVFIFSNKYAHAAWCCAIFSVSLFNGSSYYVDVFSKMYTAKFSSDSNSTNVMKSDHQQAVITPTTSTIAATANTTPVAATKKRK